MKLHEIVNQDKRYREELPLLVPRSPKVCLIHPLCYFVGIHHCSSNFFRREDLKIAVPQTCHPTPTMQLLYARIIETPCAKKSVTYCCSILSSVIEFENAFGYLTGRENLCRNVQLENVNKEGFLQSSFAPVPIPNV